MTDSAEVKSKLLVVDDNAINLEILLSLLSESYDVTVSIDGETALGILACGFEPDLILLDIMMPGMDGYEVCRRIKTEENSRAIPIIFLTSLDGKEDEALGLRLGAVDYVIKPFNPAIVRQRIKTQLELKRHRDQLQLLVDEKVRELNQAKERAQQNEASLRSVLRSAPVGIGLVIDRKIQWVNPGMEKMVGYSAAELAGQDVRLMYLDDAEYERIGRELYEQIETLGTGSLDTRFATKDGSTIDVALRSTLMDLKNPAAGVIFTALNITERNEAHRKLQKNKERLKDAQRVAQIGNWEHDLDSGKVYGSEEFYRIFDMTPSPSGGTYQLFLEAVHPDDRERVHQLYQQSIKLKRPYSIVFRLLPKNGKTQYVEAKGETRYAENGEPLLSIGTIQDITSAKIAENQIVKAKDEWESTFDAMADMVTIHDSEKRIIRANKAAHDFVGASYGELTGKISCEVFWNHSVDSPECQLGKTIRDRRAYSNIHSHSASGRVFSVTTAPISKKVNDAEYFIHVVRDITEQKLAENALRNSEEQLRTLINTTPDVICLKDGKGRWLEVNDAHLELFSLQNVDWRGKTECELAEFTEPIYQQTFLACEDTDELTWQAAKSVRAEEIVPLPDGNNKIFDLIKVPLFGPGGSRKSLVVWGRDITHQKNLQAEASRANRLAALGELAAGVAHEINNPNALTLYNSEILTAIFNDLVPRLEQTPPEDSGQMFGGLPYSDALQELPILLPAIHDSARRIKRIVNDLRDFARQDSDDLDESVNLNQVVQAAVRLVNNAIKKATDYFELNLAEPLPAVTGVSGRLEQVIINLLLNACQALENSTQKISITTLYNADIESLQVVVADQGQGMTSDVVEHIFEPFVTTKREQGGTGLGLSVSSRIVKEHHGELSFISAPGEGTTAMVTLPVRKEFADVN